MAGLTPARLKEIQNKIRPGLFMSSFAKKLEDDGDEILDSLFAIAKGNVMKTKDGKTLVTADPKDVLAAIKVICDIGAVKEVTKHLLKVAQKGRPDADPEEEAWVREYADIEARDGSEVKAPKGPPKKGA